MFESSSFLTSRPVVSFLELSIVVYGSRTLFFFFMDLKAGGFKSDKKRGPVTALLSRENSKTVRGSTPHSSSDQDSPPVVPDGMDSPLLGRTNNGAGSISRTSSIRSKRGEQSMERNTSPKPKSRDQTPETGQGDSFLSAGDSSSLGNKTTGKRMIDSAKKKILWLASKNEWGGLEQAMKTLEQTVAANKNSPESIAPLAGIQDEFTGYTPLMYAVKDNRISLMERMMELGCDLTTVNKDNYNAFHLAVLFSREDVIKNLLSRKADITIPAGPREQNVLHLVASRTGGSGASVAKMLLASGAKDFRLARDTEGYLPLHIAVEIGNMHVTKELLNMNGDLQVKATFGPKMENAFHAATRRRDIELLRILNDQGSPVDAVNADGQTALHIAAADGDENIVKYLHMLHANPNISDNEDRTPVLIAAERGKTTVVEILTEKFRASCLDRTKDGSTLLHVASFHGHPETALMLLKKGVPLHMPNKSGARSIHIAARKGHVGVIQTLLLKGEQVDATTNDNYTALHVAVQAGKANVVETLLGYGAQVHIRAGPLQETPLHIAARVTEGGEKCVQMLLKSGCNANINRADGVRPLHVAASEGHFGVVRLLLADGADPLLVNDNGETPLQVACGTSHPGTLSVVQLLLEHVQAGSGSAATYVNTRNTLGESCLHAASSQPRTSNAKGKYPDRDIAQFLLQAGGDVGLDTFQTKENPLHYCASQGNVPVLVALLASIRPTDLQRVVNKQNVLGRSPLQLAAKNGHLQCVLLFLQNQARVDVFDNDGMSALHLASESGHGAVCDALLAHNAFVNSKSRVGLTPIHLASLKGYTELVHSLVTVHHATIDALTLRKETALQLAAGAGQLDVCSLLVELGAETSAADELGRKAIHLAAQQNHSEVVRLFLKHQPALVLAANKDGNTCAHIAAMQGSVDVLQQLMKFDLSIVTASRNRTSESTPLHLAAEGGHADVVKILLEAGALPQDENKAGFTAIQLAAKNGHNVVIDVLRDASPDTLSYASRRTGLNSLHVAACYGQSEIVREMLTYVPAGVRSEAPTSLSGSGVLRELDGEAGLTPLHLASYSGDENVVRLLLNSAGVTVDQPSAQNGFTALHLACRGGHGAVAGLLLSRSTGLLTTPDGHGRSPLHVAAAHGHGRIVELLLGQGADVNAADKAGWTALHLAARAGHLAMVQLLLDSGATPRSCNDNGRIALWYAASEGHTSVLTLLLKREHDAYGLMEDRKFVYNLMVCGKNNNNLPLCEFILESPAPVDVAAKLSHILATLSVKEKERSKDLLEAAKHCESMATELLALASALEGAARLLTAQDRRQMPLLDILVEQEQKEVISHPAVQRYLQEVWLGGLQWAPWKLLLLFLCCVVLPPVWLCLCLPLGHRYDKIPVIRFMAYLTSHIYLMTLLILTSTLPICPVLRTSLLPCWYEWLLLVWLSGVLLAELATPRDRGGLGWLRIAVLFISAIAILIHAVAFLLKPEHWTVALFFRNQLLAVAVLLCCMLLLDFLSFHYLFGPWAIIIGNLMVDACRFLIILAIFMFGFTMHVAALNQPFWARDITPITAKTITGGLNSGVVVTPLDTFQLLFFALFGLTQPADLRMETAQPEWTLFFYKIVFGFYMLVTTVVLINMLIAMMSDTYQRIQAQSDVEWKFGLAKLVRAMHRTAATPSPLNLFTSWISYLWQLSRKQGITQKSFV
uniref:No mechanoreceptor potential C n=1 Tax=Daphnia magna TaxID=35525 RepID=A0A0P5ALS6_9CRUS